LTSKKDQHLTIANGRFPLEKYEDFSEKKVTISATTS
jgi:hypothetical protein